ncbi:hypothetical protein PACILC2_28010 [Paenibacillus cisolokensis]|uniref:Uncharacterized protein n=1 Tax=Paenibacillus cisolokensis TaxID=1658519 RepID=A0ABQ4N8F2_9BACL|nr:hypothetical protein PACILC2_28010 [Paenibacillus cisolokensis]
MAGLAAVQRAVDDVRRHEHERARLHGIRFVPDEITSFAVHQIIDFIRIVKLVRHFVRKNAFASFDEQRLTGHVHPS